MNSKHFAMNPYNNPENLIDQIAAQFPNMQICGCYDVDTSESSCLLRKGKDFDVKSIEAYIEVFVLADGEEEDDYCVNFDYGYQGFLAIKKLDDCQFLYMASHLNIFPYVRVFLKNLELMTYSVDEQEGVFDTQKSENKPVIKTDNSLLAAKQIQDLVLSDEHLLDDYFSDHFLLYRPEGIIGGDFYSFYEFDHVLYLVVADCTGHSVEGALASMAVSSIIKQELVSHDQDVSAVIDQIYKKIDQYNENRKNHDSYGLGVEMAICKFDRADSELTFASSGIMMIHKSKEGQKFARVKKNYDNNRRYHSDNFHLEKDDSLMIFSDGILDQFDKNNKKKLGRTGLQKLISESNVDGKLDKDTFLSNFDDWKGSTPQQDDQTLLWANA